MSGQAVTSTLAVLTLAGCGPVWRVGRHLRRRFIHAVVTARGDRTRWAEWEQANGAEVDTWRAELAAERDARDARSAELAETARAIRPVGSDIGVLR